MWSVPYIKDCGALITSRWLRGRNSRQDPSTVVCILKTSFSQRLADLKPKVRGHFAVSEAVDGEERVLEVKLRLKVMKCCLVGLS